MAAITICSDFGAPQNKVCHCIHCCPIFCLEVMGPLYLLDRVPDELWTEVHDIVQETRIKTIPKVGGGGKQNSKIAF